MSSSTISHLQGLSRIATVLVALLLFAPGLAQDEIVREGYFEVRSASSSLNDGVHLLDSRLQLVLSSEALAALASTSGRGPGRFQQRSAIAICR